MPKLRHFLWRILSESLAIGTFLLHRRVITNAIYRRCCSEDEKVDHLFFNFPYAQHIWRAANLPYLDLINPKANFETKLNTALLCHNNQALPSIIRQLPL